MKHIARVSRLPAVATTDTTGTIDIGGIISGTGKAIGSIIFASAAASSIKAVAGAFGTPASS